MTATYYGANNDDVCLDTYLGPVSHFQTPWQAFCCELAGAALQLVSRYPGTVILLGIEKMININGNYIQE